MKKISNYIKNMTHKDFFMIIIFCLVLLLPILLVGIYNRPSADDYDYAILTHKAIQQGGNFNIIGVLKAAIQTDINFYNTWQGLYSSAFLLSLQPAIFGEKLYFLTTVIIFFIGFICVYESLKILNRHFIHEDNKFVLTFTVIILTILFLLLPSATEGLFWFNGAMNYMPWAFTNFLSLALLIEIFYSKNGSKKYYGLLVLVTLLSFFTSGGDHVTAFANILFMTIISIILIVRKKKYYSLFPLISAIIGFIIMYIAPGTAARQAAFVTPTVKDTIINTYNYVKGMLGPWMSFQWLLTLIIVTPLSLKIANSIENKVNIYVPIISIVCSLIVICGMYATPYYAMGGFGAPRLENVVWVTFIILSWINYTFILAFIKNKRIVKINLSKKNLEKYYTIAILICLGIIFYIPQNHKFSNSYICLHELENGTAKRFAQQMDNRIWLFNQNDIKEVKLPRLTPGSILYFADLGTDPNAWPNTSIEEYYGKTIYIDE